MKFSLCILNKINFIQFRFYRLNHCKFFFIYFLCIRLEWKSVRKHRKTSSFLLPYRLGLIVACTVYLKNRKIWSIAYFRVLFLCSRSIIFGTFLKQVAKKRKSGQRQLCSGARTSIWSFHYFVYIVVSIFSLAFVMLCAHVHKSIAVRLFLFWFYVPHETVSLSAHNSSEWIITDNEQNVFGWHFIVWVLLFDNRPCIRIIVQRPNKTVHGARIHNIQIKIELVIIYICSSLSRTSESTFNFVHELFYNDKQLSYWFLFFCLRSHFVYILLGFLRNIKTRTALLSVY